MTTPLQLQSYTARAKVQEARPAHTVHQIAITAPKLLPKPEAYGAPGVPPTPSSLVEALRLRGVRVYPDLEGGIGFIARGIDYADLRPLLVARKAETVAYLESELFSQRLLELMAFYGWPLEKMRAVWLDRLERSGTRHHWKDDRIEYFLRKALARAEDEPEVLVTIGYSTRLLRWYPLVTEVADHLAELGAGEGEILAALRTNNVHHDLGYLDQYLAEVAHVALFRTQAFVHATPAKPSPAQPAPHMGKRLRYFAEVHGYRCAACNRQGGQAGDPDGRVWHEGKAEGAGQRLLCDRCMSGGDEGDLI